MSRKIHIDSVPQDRREKIMKDLTIKIEPSSYVFNAQPTYIYPVDVTETHGYIPFAYNRSFPRPERKSFTQVKPKFVGSLRPQQIVVRKEAISNLNKYGSIIIAAFPGFGKCLALNTPIIMFDGSIKMVQDIKTGEQLMGDDSKPRNVLSTCTGKEQMYEIQQVKGDNYKVNESHILTLKMSGHKSIMKIKTRSKKIRYSVKKFNTNTVRIEQKSFEFEDDAIKYKNTIKTDGIIDICVKDYLKLPQSVKAKLKCFKVPVRFEEKPVKLDPYFLGLWLGDGTSNQSQITTADKEIVDYLKKYCVVNKLRLYQGKRSSTTRNDYHYTIYGSVRGKTDTNTVLNQLKYYNLIKNKHIPDEYKYNSRDVQLKVLAGLIDSDGYYEKNCYEIVQKREQLANDIVYISRSLGFASFVKKVKKTCTNSGKNGDERKTGTYYRVDIYGNNLADIPVLLDRKRGVQRKQIKNPLVTGIKVVPIDEKDYYGFTIDGNHRFLLGDFTVTHNTATAINISARIGMKTLVLTHRIVLIKQWKDSLKKFCPESKVQVLTTKSKMKEGCDFYIMNPTNVPKKSREFYKDIGTVIVDECHLIMSEVMSKSLTMLVPRYLIGLSATPYREDGLNVLLDLYFGKRKIVRELHREHHVYKLNTGFTPDVELAKNGRVNWGSILDSQANDVHRNKMIVRLVKYFPDRVFLILCKRVAQGHYIVDTLKKEGVDVTSLIGKQQEYEQKSRVLVGTTGKCSTGFDHPRLNTLILASDIQAYFIQVLGRIFRTEDGIPMVFDLVDKNPILERHYKVRQAVYLKHGGKVKYFDREFPDFKI